MPEPRATRSVSRQRRTPCTPSGRSVRVRCGDLGTTMTPWSGWKRPLGQGPWRSSSVGAGRCDEVQVTDPSGRSVGRADDLQRCRVLSTALAARQPATSVTLLLAILEAGRARPPNASLTTPVSPRTISSHSRWRRRARDRPRFPGSQPRRHVRPADRWRRLARRR
jgi:hypothetical protein